MKTVTKHQTNTENHRVTLEILSRGTFAVSELRYTLGMWMH